MTKYITKVLGTAATRVGFIVGVILFVVVGSVVFMHGHALTSSLTFETEDGSNSGCVHTVSDASASGNSAVTFGGCGAANSSDPSQNAGASLPIQYDLSSLTGTVIYVSPSGSDSNGGTVGSPYATLTKAISAAPAGATIVLRGGTYRQGNINVGKSLKITAYPGEIPVFDGAQSVSSTNGWTTAGSASYRTYTPMPVTDGSGISFTSCQNLNSGCLGKYPDQAWVGSKQLQQVATQAEVTAGTFYVDSTNSRIYLDSGDVSSGNIEVSNLRHFMSVSSPNVTISGFQVVRYSNSASDYGVFIVYGTADNYLMDNMLVSDSAFITISVVVSGSNDLNENSTIQNSTIQYGNWMGVSILGTNSFKLDHDYIANMNQFNEFTASPQSGALKTSRTWYTAVVNSKIMNNNSQGVWFDESNYKAEVEGNDMEGNSGSALFYEISDYIYIVNNYIRASGGAKAVKMAASTDLYMINNTIIGGSDPVGVYVDHRSLPGCSTYTNSACTYDGANKDTYHTHPITMTWLPSINLFIDNIIAYPTAAGYCSSTTAICITHSNATATVSADTIIHQADPSNAVPQTLIDGNVYANGSGNIVDLESVGSYSTTAAFAGATAGSPINISGFETHGLYGNSYVNSDGSPTAALTDKNSTTLAVPNDATINKYVPAGNKHYGVLWK